MRRRSAVVVFLWSAASVTLGASARASDPAAARAAAERVESTLARMDEVAQGVRSRLAGARASHDAALLQCLGGKLSEIEGAVRKARDVRATARAAVAHDDEAGGAAALASLESLAERVTSLGAACAATEFAEVTVARLESAPAESDEQAEPAAPPPDPAPAPAPAPAAFAPPPAAPPPSRPAGSPYAADAPHEATMLVYTADLTLAVFEVEKGLAAVEKIAKDSGGYLSQRSDQQIAVRVPRPRFDEAMLAVAKLGDVLHKNVSAEDVTDEYTDLDLRLKNERVTRDRLETLLATAGVKEAIEIHRELAKVTEEIERLEGRLKVLRDRIGFSTITVSFQAAPPQQAVRSSAHLPFPWMQSLGLSRLLRM